MPGDERAQPTSGGWDFRGGISCGGVDGTASKLLTCTRLPPTNLNVCRQRDCLGQPLKESAGEEPISGTCGRPASWSSSGMVVPYRRMCWLVRMARTRGTPQTIVQAVWEHRTTNRVQGPMGQP